MRVARRYVIAGRVQGVGFRYFALRMAGHEGVDGWVRNLPDGRVEASAEGEFEAIERFETRLRQGPPGARVEAVEVEDTVPETRGAGFHVR